jgi:hypothetical protein
MTLSAARSLTASFGWTRFTVSGHFGVFQRGV